MAPHPSPRPQPGPNQSMMTQCSHPIGALTQPQVSSHHQPATDPMSPMQARFPPQCNAGTPRHYIKRCCHALCTSPCPLYPKESSHSKNAQTKRGSNPRQRGAHTHPFEVALAPDGLHVLQLPHQPLRHGRGRGGAIQCLKQLWQLSLQAWWACADAFACERGSPSCQV
jgi:hypothetical protein